MSKLHEVNDDQIRTRSVMQAKARLLALKKTKTVDHAAQIHTSWFIGLPSLQPEEPLDTEPVELASPSQSKSSATESLQPVRQLFLPRLIDCKRGTSVEELLSPTALTARRAATTTEHAEKLSVPSLRKSHSLPNLTQRKQFQNKTRSIVSLVGDDAEMRRKTGRRNIGRKLFGAELIPTRGSKRAFDMSLLFTSSVFNNMTFSKFTNSEIEKVRSDPTGYVP